MLRVLYEIEVPGLAEAIRDARAGRQVQALASAAGISQGHWYSIESGRVGVKFETLLAIEEALGVELSGFPRDLT